MLLDNSHLVVSESRSILGFQTEWDRFLTIDGKKAYNFGNVCGTCAFLFERLEGANQGIDTKAIIAELNEGFSRIQVPVINALKLLLTVRTIFMKPVPLPCYGESRSSPDRGFGPYREGLEPPQNDGWKDVPTGRTPETKASPSHDETC